MAKRILALLLSVVLTVLLGACGETVGCTIYYPVYEKMTSCDPQIASTDTEKIIATNCFEGLVRVDADGNIAPAAASSWTISPDGLTYSFRLREGGAWHLTSYAKKELSERLPADLDTRVVADDFVYGLQRALSAQTNAPDAYMLLSIANADSVRAGAMSADALGVHAISDYTLQISLSEPQANFLYALTECVAMPCKRSFFEACGGRYGLLVKYYLTNGPFYLAQFSEDDTYTLTAAEDYTGAFAAKPAKVLLYYNAEGTGVPEKITDEIYSGAYLTHDMYDSVKLSEKATVTTLDNTTTAFVFNLNDPTLQNDALREAFCLATDTPALAKNAGYLYAESLIPSICRLQPTCANDYSEELAATRLREALTQTAQTSITLTILTANEYTDLLRRQMQQWQRILGVSCIIRVNGVSATTLNARVAAGEYQIALYPITARTPDALGFLLSFAEDCPDNFLSLGDEGFTQTITAAKAASDADATRMITAAAQYLTDKHFILPVFNESAYLVETAGVSGLYCYTCADRVYFNEAFSEN